MNKIGSIKKGILGTLVTSTLAYAGTFGAMAGFGEADAGTREVGPQACHTKFDDNNSTLNNSGALTNAGTGSKDIYCPLVSDNTVLVSSSLTASIYGTEVADGSNSKTCVCAVNPITCGCSPHTNWVNNAGGTPGLVAPNISGSALATGSGQKFAYFLHVLSAGSAIAGMRITAP